jgi:hypothetical protein
MTSSRILAGIIFLVVLGFYLLSAAPSIYWEDSAAFQLAATELGIPHNPSFPLYLILTRVLVLLPLATPVFMANAASALFTAGSAVLVYLLALRVAGRIADRSPLSQLLAVSAALVFATSEAV